MRRFSKDESVCTHPAVAGPVNKKSVLINLYVASRLDDTAILEKKESNISSDSTLVLNASYRNEATAAVSGIIAHLYLPSQLHSHGARAPY